MPLRCGGIFDIGSKEEELTALEKKQADPGFWNDQNKAKVVIASLNRIRSVTGPFAAIESLIHDADTMIELAGEENDPEAAQEAFAEANKAVSACSEKFEKMELQALLSGEMDGSNAYVTLHAGAGGTESCDWADMLFRMYSRYCERHEFDVEVMDYQAGDEAGLKSVTLHISGAFAFGYLKVERGVHRLVRISPFDANKRRHTSFAALDVVPEVADDIDVEIDESDLKIDTYRASGAGGQHVNTTDSAVRITHLPSGIVCACQAERSQHKNKAAAMKVLKGKLYEYLKDQKKREMERFYAKKGEIAWGSQIRSYVMQPYTMVKDHRSSEETSNVQAVLDGDLQNFIEAQLRNAAKTAQPDS
jgi:peptide chain release factor 2